MPTLQVFIDEIAHLSGKVEKADVPLMCGVAARGRVAPLRVRLVPEMEKWLKRANS